MLSRGAEPGRAQRCRQTAAHSRTGPRRRADAHRGGVMSLDRAAKIVAATRDLYARPFARPAMAAARAVSGDAMFPAVPEAPRGFPARHMAAPAGGYVSA